MTECRIPQPLAFFFSMLLLSGALSGQPAIEKALLKAACIVISSDMNEDEIRSVLEAGLWSDDSSAVAISIPRQDEYMTFVFRLQPDGTFSATDVSWIANTVFGAWGFPRDEIERFETKPVSWRSGNRGNLLLRIQTRGWREGRRYTGWDVYLVSPDGALTNR